MATAVATGVLRKRLEGRFVKMLLSFYVDGRGTGCAAQ